MTTYEERVKDLTCKYGEVCYKADAAQILHKDPRTINKMLADGRLDRACEGTMVCVRSIARYIHAPAKAEEEGRVTRLKRRIGCEYAAV